MGRKRSAGRTDAAKRVRHQLQNTKRQMELASKVLVLAARRIEAPEDTVEQCRRLGARALALPTDVRNEQQLGCAGAGGAGADRQPRCLGQQCRGHLFRPAGL
jgi:hypothetical protein